MVTCDPDWYHWCLYLGARVASLIVASGPSRCFASASRSSKMRSSQRAIHADVPQRHEAVVAAGRVERAGDRALRIIVAAREGREVEDGQHGRREAGLRLGGGARGREQRQPSAAVCHCGESYGREVRCTRVLRPRNCAARES